MVKRFLITRPKHDIPTSYLHDFSKDLVKNHRRNKDIHIADLEGSLATRIETEEILKKEKPGLVFLNGHGDKERVGGHQDEIILDKENIGLTKDMIVYALACDSSDILGRLAIEMGTLAYIGYREKFMIVREPSREGTPQKDRNALPFKIVCNVLMDSLLSGEQVGHAISRTKKEYIHQIRSFGTSEDDPFGDIPLIRFALAWNLEFLDMQGNHTACF